MQMLQSTGQPPPVGKHQPLLALLLEVMFLLLLLLLLVVLLLNHTLLLFLLLEVMPCYYPMQHTCQADRWHILQLAVRCR
jgi:hypothetical protein